MGKRTIDAINENLGRRDDITIGEIGKNSGVNIESDFNIKDKVASEAFANDLLEVMFHEDIQQGALEIINPSVNGVNQPIIRGVKQRIKRKYVEVMARCRTIMYTTVQQDPSRPDSVVMRPKEMLTYPFSVLHDPKGEAGREWLEGILRTPA